MGAVRDTSDHPVNVEVEYGLFVDGEFKEPSSGKSIPIEYPYTREVWAQAPRGTAEDIDHAVASAREAFHGDEWQSLGPKGRSDLLHEMADVLEDHADKLAELTVRENGRTITDMKAEALGNARWLRYYASLCLSELEGRTIPVENKGGQFHTYVSREPYGVVGGVTAWNSPRLITIMKLAPALAAGNTFVQKPSEHTPIGDLRMAELFYEETSLPDGVYNVVPGYGDEAGRALTEHPDVDYIGVTGSVPTGKAIAASAGENLTPVQAELGGKNPNVVFPSADFDNAANGIVKGIFQASGEACTAGSRLLVHEDVRDDVLERVRSKVQGITIGDPMDPDTDIGPLAFEGQVEKVRTFVEDADSPVTTIGDLPTDAPQDLFVRPTIIADVESDDSVAQEEVFGPVLSVLTFADETKAIETANDVDYGLSAGIWTEDMRQAHRVADAIQAGIIWVNEYRQATFNAPFGGFKDSGMGYEEGKEGLAEYLRSKTVWVDLSGEVPEPFTEHTIVEDD